MTQSSPERFSGTKASWIALAQSLSDAAISSLPEPSARWLFDERTSSHGVEIDELEAVSRSFFLAAILSSADSTRDSNVQQLLQTILVRLDERAALAWSAPTYGTSNALLEAASISLGLWISKTVTWDRLTRAEKKRIAGWLRSAVRYDTSVNNWIFFPVVTSLFLDTVGEGDGSGLSRLDDALERLESWSKGGGWYSDGPGSSIDYYNSWALHFYPAVLSHLASLDLVRQREQLRQFLDTFVELFSRDEGHVYFGRSLGYRFGAAASMSAAGLIGADLDLARLRAISSNDVRYFLDRGALDPTDPLPLGWFRRQSSLAQAYSGPRANFWAAKTFLNLLIPDSSSYWHAYDDEIVEQDKVVRLGGTHMLAIRTGEGQVVRLLNQESWNIQSERRTAPVDDPFYSRAIYSNVTAPVDGTHSRDSSLTIHGRWGVSSRVKLQPRAAGPAWLASSYTVRIKNRWHVRGRIGWHLGRILPVGPHRDAFGPVQTLSAVHDGWIVEFFLVPRTGRRAVWTYGGHALPAKGATRQLTDDGASVYSCGLHSEIRALAGFKVSGIDTSNSESPFGQHFIIPLVQAAAGDEGMLAAASWLGLEQASAPPRLDRSDGAAHIRWSDGSSFDVDLSTLLPTGVAR